MRRDPRRRPCPTRSVHVSQSGMGLLSAIALSTSSWLSRCLLTDLSLSCGSRVLSRPTLSSWLSAGDMAQRSESSEGVFAFFSSESISGGISGRISPSSEIWLCTLRTRFGPSAPSSVSSALSIRTTCSESRPRGFVTLTRQRPFRLTRTPPWVVSLWVRRDSVPMPSLVRSKSEGTKATRWFSLSTRRTASALLFSVIGSVTSMCGNRTTSCENTMGTVWLSPGSSAPSGILDLGSQRGVIFQRVLVLGPAPLAWDLVLEVPPELSNCPSYWSSTPLLLGRVHTEAPQS